MMLDRQRMLLDQQHQQQRRRDVSLIRAAISNQHLNRHLDSMM
jgi:hypothetical protein